MYKKNNYTGCFSSLNYQKNSKIIKIMRLCIFFSIVFTFSLTANSYSQTQRLTIEKNNVTIAEIFSEIEATSEFSFLYSSMEIDVHQFVSVAGTDVLITDILSSILKGTDIAYRIADRHIILYKTDAAPKNNAITQQVVTVVGTVSDESGNPLPGANVFVKGTMRGVSTDVNGKYQIQVTSSETLVFTYIGYITQEIEVGSRTQIDVRLAEDLLNIDEVVVVGYGVMRKSDLTSSITKISGESVQSMNTGDVSSAMQGLAPGVLVISGSGSPGAEPTVMIRGITSINLSSAPLYVVDGMPMSTSINFLNPADIENIEVLKDASASAIYGSLASNGVIMITTKKGLAGKPKFSAEVSYGIQLMKQPFEMADVSEYVRAMNSSFTNSEMSPLTELSDPSLLNRAATPWWDTGIAKMASQVNANISVRGGNDFSKYSAGISYYEQESFYKLAPREGKWQRFSARVTNDFNFAKWLTAGYMFNPRFQSSGSPGNWGDYLRIDPITPIYKPAQELTGDENEFSIYGRSDLSYIWNPVAANKRFFDRDRNLTLAGNAYIDLKPLPGLVFKSLLGYDYRFRYRDQFEPNWVIDGAHEKADINQVSRNHDLRSMFSWSNTLTYMGSYKKHNYTAMLGNTMDRVENRTMSGSRQGIPNNSEPLREISAGTLNHNVSGNTVIDRALIGYFGRVNYNYDNRYLLTATMRRDGSSKFMQRNKWANFPSVSVAWHLGNENFMKSIDEINILKLRAGWGQVGNQGIPSAVYESLLSGSGNDGFYVYQENSVNRVHISSLKNEDIKWETVEDTSFGIDFGLWKNKLSGSIDYYIKNTRDMLFQKPYPLYSGFPSSAQIWTNIGTMRSKGWDLALTYRNSIKDFKYSATLNFTTFDVKVTQMASDTPIYGAAITNTTVYRNVTEVGEEPGYFWGYVMDGIFQTQAEVDAHVNKEGVALQPYAKPGDVRFLDTDKDGRISGNDRKKLGSPWADFTAGLNINLGYKGFDLMMHFYGSYGNDIANYDVTNGLHNGTNGANFIKGINEKAWHGQGTSNRIPILRRSDVNESFYKFSSLHVEDGSYLKLKNVQLGYTLPSNLTKDLGISGVRVYLSGQNLLTFTKFTGVDPEVSGGGRDDGFTSRAFGFAGWQYPQLRTFIFGINFNF